MRDNIAAFSGDPGDVTVVVGESSGASAISCLLVTTFAKGLFLRVARRPQGTGWIIWRAKDPPPGSMVLWRGLGRLVDIEMGVQLGRATCGQMKAVRIAYSAPVWAPICPLPTRTG